MTAPKSTHVAWNFVQKDGYNLSCQLCGHNFNGDLTRAVEHLLGISNGSGSGVEACTKITDEQKATVCKDRFNPQMQKQKRVNKRPQIEREIVMSSSNTINSVSNIGGSSCTRAKTGGTKTSNQFWKPVEKQEVDDAVAEFFYACAIPFNVARSPYFKNVIKKAIDFGKGYVPPGSKALGTTLLKRTKDRVPGKFADIKESWKVTGCTILSEGWSDLCHRSLINVFVYCPRGVFLLKTIDATDQVKTSKFIFEILNKAILEVGVGNVVHVVTDTASNCVDAGDLIMKNYNQIYWTPCASHYLYLMLQDLAKFHWVDETIKGAKTISNFIINHSLTLSIYMKNASKELRPCDTKITAFYVTLKTIVEEKASVSAVFCNNEWKRSTLSKEIEGKNVEQIVLNHGFWENANKVLKICGPIIDVILMVDGDKPCMGFVYEKINCCKKTIATAFNNVEADYKEIWDLIDHRWKKMHSPLYAAACYLNPRLFELLRHRGDQEDKEIMNGLFQCIEKLNPNRVAESVIKSQLWEYYYENGLFGDKSAKDDRTRSDPALWWESYGSGVPELQNFAIRILSQGTSTLACERKWSSFDHIHSKKKNRLLFGRSKDLVYVRNNLQLAVKGNKSKYDDEQEDNSDDAYGLETSSDLSQAFSDSVCSSSDISRELLRLATASSSPVYSPNNFRNNNNDLLKEPVSQAQCMSKLAKSRQFEEERIRSEEERVQSNPHTSSSTTKATSESKNELLEPEKLEVFVKGLVDDLGPGNSKSVQRKAAADLRVLAKDKMEIRTMIAKAGAVMPLICLLHSTDPQTQEAAVTALLNLSLCDDNIIKISQAGAIKPLIDVLKAGTSVAKQNAAFALSRLSRKDDNKFTIGAEGAIPHLVALLISGSSRGKKDAATTLYTLSSRTLNKDRAIRAGAIKPLVELMEDPYSGMADKAVVVLRNLASVPDGNTAIVEHGGIPVLVKMIEFGSQKGREFATETLLHLCEHSYLYRKLVLKEGVIPPLMVLSQSGTARAKAKAATLLWYLRECQESL